MPLDSSCRIWLAAAAVATTSLSPSPAHAQQYPTVRPLGKIVATTSDLLSSQVSVRPLSDGRVFVNDIGHHRVLLYDSTLTHATVVMDSAGTAVRAYGNRPGGMLAYFGDSTLFVDQVAQAMVVVDPDGRIARTMAVPPGEALTMLTAAGLTQPGMDSRGRLIFRGSSNPGRDLDLLGNGPRFTAGPLARFDFASRVLDTAANVRISTQVPNEVTKTAGGQTTRSFVDPLIVIDAWTVTRDGRLAIIRAADYHIDWITADGKITSTAKIPHEWEKLSDSDKAAIVDSVRKTLPAPRTSPPRPGSISVTMISDVLDADHLPDYMPLIKANTLRGDFDSNLWIPPQTLHPVFGGLVYDVINTKGELIDRVQMPGGTTVVAFGPGSVYLTSRKDNGLVLAKARVH